MAEDQSQTLNTGNGLTILDHKSTRPTSSAVKDCAQADRAGHTDAAKLPPVLGPSRDGEAPLRGRVLGFKCKPTDTEPASVKEEA